MLMQGLAMIGAGFTLGLVHAMDADHVMAVTALSNEKPGFARTLRFSLQWAIGHGGILLLVGGALLGFGITLPETVTWLAEVAIGFILIFLGFMCFVQLKNSAVKLNEHSHGDVTHTHWHSDEHVAAQYDKDDKKAHAPVMVGVLHGIAGSAPALALVPALVDGRLGLGLMYLAVFSFGVLLAMSMFGMSLAWVQSRLQKYHQLLQIQRYAIASVSIVFGGYWLSEAI